MKAAILLLLWCSAPLSAGSVALYYDGGVVTTFFGSGTSIAFDPGWTIQPNWTLLYFDSSIYGVTRTFGSVTNPLTTTEPCYGTFAGDMSISFGGSGEYANGLQSDSCPGTPTLGPGETVPFEMFWDYPIQGLSPYSPWPSHPTGQVDFNVIAFPFDPIEGGRDYTNAGARISLFAVFATPEPSPARLMVVPLAILAGFVGLRRRWLRS